MRKLTKMIVLLLLLAMAAAPIPALAADGPLTVEIPFTVNKASSTVIIEALDGAPEPATARYENIINDGAFSITFNDVGDFYYKVYQQEGKDKKKYFDTTEFDVGISIIYAEDGGLASIVNISKGNNPGKLDKVEFTNPPPTTLEVVKTAWRDGREVTEVFAGDTITYQIQVRNVGDGAAYNVVVYDTLPTRTPKLTVATDTISDDGKLTDDGEKVVWEFEELAGHSDITVSFDVIVPGIDSYMSWVNTVQVTFDDPEVPNAYPTDDVTITEDLPYVTIDIEQARNDGARTKELLYVDGGDRITYYVTITNGGGGTALDASITDEIPEGLTLVNGSISNGGTVSGGVVTWELNNLSPRESKTVSFSATVPKVTEKTSWINRATGVYTDGSRTNAKARIAGVQVELPTNEVEAVEVPEAADGAESGSNASNVPQTGDNTKLILWLSLMGISLIGIIIAVVMMLRQGKKRK